MQYFVIFCISDIEVFAFIWFVHEPVIYQKAQSCISTKYVSKISIFYVIQYEGLWQHLTEILHWYAFWKSTGNQCNPQIIQWIRYKKKERWHCMVGHNKVTIFFLKTKDLINTEGLFLIILFFLYTLYKCLAFSLPLLNNLNANITRDSWTISLTLATRTSLWPKQLFSLDST